MKMYNTLPQDRSWRLYKTKMSYTSYKEANQFHSMMSGVYARRIDATYIMFAIENDMDAMALQMCVSNVEPLSGYRIDENIDWFMFNDA